MKLILRLYLLLMTTSILFSQNNEETEIKLGNYIFTSSFETKVITDFYGTTISKTSTIHRANSIVNAIKIINDSVIVQYYKAKELSNKKQESKGQKFNSTFYENDNQLKYYKIKIDDFKKVTTYYYNRYKGVAAGIYSVPFKLRFNDFDFEQNLNVGISIGCQYRISKKIDHRWFLEPNIGIGLAKINLNSKNSDVQDSRTASAFSLSSGLILHFSKTINAGCFVGWDFLSNTDSDTNWIHNGKTWLGLGINIGFNISEGKVSKEKN